MVISLIESHQSLHSSFYGLTGTCLRLCLVLNETFWDIFWSSQQSFEFLLKCHSSFPLNTSRLICNLKLNFKSSITLTSFSWSWIFNAIQVVQQVLDICSKMIFWRENSNNRECKVKCQFRVKIQICWNTRYAFVSFLKLTNFCCFIVSVQQSGEQILMSRNN